MTSENKAITYQAARYILIIIAAVAPIIATGVTFENRLSATEEKFAKCDSLEARVSNSDIKYAEIKTSLEGIKVMQQDILNRLQR